MNGTPASWFILAWLIPLLPIAAALAIWLRALLSPRNGDASEAFPAGIARAACLLSLFGLLALAGLAVLAGLPVGGQVPLGVWFSVGGVELPLSLWVDPLALSVGGIFALLGCLSLSFSTRYMHREDGFARFLAALSLFIGAMLLLILAGSALLAFVGWELAGVASFLLIGYARGREVATGNALRAFLTNRIGDAAFLMSLGFALWWAGTLDWPALAARLQGMESVNAGLIALGFVIAALVKSGQFPFSPWIGRALEGPTPSSAIFYGSLYVHAGVFLVLRLAPLLQHVPQLSWLLVAAGGATVVYAWLSGLVQTDVKSSLLLSTLVQVGLMFIACGFGFFTFAALHLVAHALWRSWQFLHAPSWLALGQRRPSPPPAWLARHVVLYTSALQRFWLELLGDTLLTRPTERLGRDMANIDARLIEHLLGEPATLPRSPEEAAKDPLAHRGIGGTLLLAVAQRLTRFEDLLLVQKNGGRAAFFVRRVGDLLMRIETLLQEPRYIFLFVMATLVVIL
jgi:formate hydrogenlyase subunit 3/multisubunit Na+/H+ antiporter MnhD subunit